MADIQRYLNLVTSQHQNKPKFAAWLSAPLGILDDVVSLAKSFNYYFDIDLAIGVQLDTLGEILGVERAVTFQPTTFYSLGVTGVTYYNNPSPVLDDDVYRLVLRSKILQNMWDGTLPSLYEMWSILFKGAYITVKDNQNMTMDVSVSGLSSQMQKDLMTNGYIIPRPEGVAVNYIYLGDPFFSYGLDTDDFKGYEDGYWAQYF
ncbi:DUF2612 domain-containing protein [Desulfosporosinus fructosivorans]|uniref:DUF2612 domain-containing protein n=1 Tax=Desulfosporosinus fructosivorans TaxID=2018669 RepID=A0A4Z0R1J8_9FIRM|nr:DUF2612 domain-containing protein [Desulfosporosinus fructosivorans]TGE35867.1 DUF2612 domain-containing protein [Desulfosporosinus fructosivorans]